jgi:hypothetical protein
MAANQRQVAGTHYRSGGLQHWDIVSLMRLDYFQAQITKYVMRWKSKNGVQDLQKAQHFIEKYIEVNDQYKQIAPPADRADWLALLGATEPPAEPQPEPVNAEQAVAWLGRFNLRRGYDEHGAFQLTLSEWITKVGKLPAEYMVVPKEAVKPTGWAGFVFEGTKGGPDGEFDGYRCDKCHEHFKVLHLEPPVTHRCSLVVP